MIDLLLASSSEREVGAASALVLALLLTAIVSHSLSENGDDGIRHVVMVIAFVAILLPLICAILPQFWIAFTAWAVVAAVFGGVAFYKSA